MSLKKVLLNEDWKMAEEDLIKELELTLTLIETEKDKIESNSKQLQRKDRWDRRDQDDNKFYGTVSKLLGTAYKELERLKEEYKQRVISVKRGY